MQVERLIDRAQDADCPLLVMALCHPDMAFSVKQEWLVEEPDAVEGHARVREEFNYQQIFRNQRWPNEDDEKTTEELLTEHLRDIERALWDGKRELIFNGAAPWSKLGGVIELLGREPTTADFIQLRILRPTQIHYHESMTDPKADTEEVISEVALLALAGRESDELVPRPEWMTDVRDVQAA